MTTAPPLTKRPAFDENGDYMTLVTEEYAVRAVARGEAVISEGHLVVVPQDARPLTPEEKRKIVQAKERAKR